jgi:hypothetical protein
MESSNATTAMQRDQDKKGDERGQGFPQILHDRSRTAGTELHKLLLSLSTGGVAVYFVALTRQTAKVGTFGGNIFYVGWLLFFSFPSGLNPYSRPR